MDKFASLEGKIALVTGAASGIGLACAEMLAKGGAKIMLTDMSLEACQAMTDQLAVKGYQVACLEQNVVDENRWDEVVEACVAQFGGLDVLVNNAGIFLGGLLESNTLDQVHRVQQVNIDSVFLGMRAAAKVMKPGGIAGKGGSIINLSSAAGVIGLPGHASYGATKGAVRMYTKHAAVEYGALQYGIRVNSVHPGLIGTTMGEQAYQDLVDTGLVASVEEARGFVAKITPMGREGHIDEVASMVRFLASDASSYCTGGEFMVDGGASA